MIKYECGDNPIRCTTTSKIKTGVLPEQLMLLGWEQSIFNNYIKWSNFPPFWMRLRVLTNSILYDGSGKLSRQEKPCALAQLIFVLLFVKNIFKEMLLQSFVKFEDPRLSQSTRGSPKMETDCLKRTLSDDKVVWKVLLRCISWFGVSASIASSLFSSKQ